MFLPNVSMKEITKVKRFIVRRFFLNLGYLWMLWEHGHMSRKNVEIGVNYV